MKVPIYDLQKAYPPQDFSELESCNLLQSFMNNKLNSVVQLATDKGCSDISSSKTNILFGSVYIVIKSSF